MSKSAIEWTEATWNPWIGCTRVSGGCRGCYAGREENTRFKHLDRCKGGSFFDGPVYQGDKVLSRPLHWKKPRMLFVCSRSDLFHEFISFAEIDRVWTTMAQSPQHTFQVLTKRPERMHMYLTSQREALMPLCESSNFLPNVWLGVTAENQERADERIPILLECPAALRFVSLEPLLGPISLVQAEPCPECLGEGFWWAQGPGPSYVRSYGDPPRHKVSCEACGGGFCAHGDGAVRAWPDGLDWVIAGSESGPDRRPAAFEWFQSLRDECVEFEIPFFLKQIDYSCFRLQGKLVKMPELDGRVWAEIPEVSR